MTYPLPRLVNNPWVAVTRLLRLVKAGYILQAQGRPMHLSDAQTFPGRFVPDARSRQQRPGPRPPGDALCRRYRNRRRGGVYPGELVAFR